MHRTWAVGWDTSISEVYGVFSWRMYMEGSLLKPVRSSATPGQGNQPSATLNHMVRTFQRAANLDNVSIEVWGCRRRR